MPPRSTGAATTALEIRAQEIEQRSFMNPAQAFRGAVAYTQRLQVRHSSMLSAGMQVMLTRLRGVPHALGLMKWRTPQIREHCSEGTNSGNHLALHFVKGEN